MIPFKTSSIYIGYIYKALNYENFISRTFLLLLFFLKINFLLLLLFVSEE
jgi:hypothetical protein